MKNQMYYRKPARPIRVLESTIETFVLDENLLDRYNFAYGIDSVDSEVVDIKYIVIIF